MDGFNTTTYLPLSVDFHPKTLNRSINDTSVFNHTNSPNGILTLKTDTNIIRPIQLNIQPQGPLTNDYFGHDLPNYNTAAIVESLSTSYEPPTEEQHFYNGYSDWGHVITHSERTILPDLEPYSFPSDIKNQSDVIYNKMIYRVHRGRIRTQLVFYCVYCSHLELKREINPVKLGAQFGLTRGEVQRCDSIFSYLQTGYRPPYTDTSPRGCIRDYCIEAHLSEEATTEVMNLTTTILLKDPTLYQENPETVAAGIFRYYIFINGIIIDEPRLLNTITDRSNATIESMFRRISLIDNS